MTHSPKRNLAWSRATWGCVLAALTVTTVTFFHPFFIQGRVISSNDVAYGVAGYAEMAPPGFAKPHNYLLADQVQQFHAYRTFLLRHVREGVWPRWMPHILCGNDFTGNIQSQSWYPLTYLGLGLPLPLADTIARVLECWLAGLGMVLLLKQVGRVHPVAAVFAAIAYMLCGYRVVWLNHPHASSATWLPWLLWAVERLLVRRGREPRMAGVLAICVYACIAAGHPQTFIHSFLLTACYAVYRLATDPDLRGGRETWTIKAPWLAAGLLMGAMCAGVVLLPFGAALFENSSTYGDRAGIAHIGGQPLRGLIGLVLPDWHGNPVDGTDTGPSNYNERTIFCGTAVVWMILAALPRLARRREAWFFLGTAVVVVMVWIRVPLISPLVRNLPVLRDLAVIRLGYLLQFGIAASAGLAMDALLQVSPAAFARSVRLGRVLFLMCLACLVIWVLTVYPQHPDAVRFAWASGLTGCGLAARWWWRVRPAIPAGAVCLVLLLDLVTVYGDYNPALKLSVARLPEPPVIRETHALCNEPWFRIAGTDGTLSPNFAIYHGLYDVRGYDLPMSARYVDFLRHAFYQGEWRYGMIYWHCGGDAFRDPHLARLQGLMGIRVLLEQGRAEAFPAGVRAHPYAYVPMQPDASTGSIEQDVARLRIEDIDLIELSSGRIPDPLSVAASVRVRERRINGVTLDLEIPADAVVAIQEMPLDGWRAFIDGKRVETFPVNVIHTGARVPEGSHVVRFAYFPTSFRAGLMVSGGGLILLLGCLAWPRHQGAGVEPSGTVPR